MTVGVQEARRSRVYDGTGPRGNQFRSLPCCPGRHNDSKEVSFPVRGAPATPAPAAEAWAACQARTFAGACPGAARRSSLRRDLDIEQLLDLRPDAVERVRPVL